MTFIARWTICGNARVVRNFAILRGQGNIAGRVGWGYKEVACAPRGSHILGGQLGRRLQSSVSESVSSSATFSSAEPAPSNTKSNPPPPPPPSKARPVTRALVFLLTSALCFTLGFTMAAAPVVAPALDTARAALEPPTDEETLSLFNPTEEEILRIEEEIQKHPLTQSLLADPKYIASRPHLKIPEALRSQNLTGGTLLGADKIAVPPLQFHTADGSSFVSLQWLGPALCGHPGIVHGGLIATLLDEGTARCCFPALPNKVAVTASLKIDYKYPTFAGQVVVLKAETTKVEGRKAWVKGRLETLVDESKGETPKVLAEAEALFIEPRGADKMKRVAAQ